MGHRTFPHLTHRPFSSDLQLLCMEFACAGSWQLAAEKLNLHRHTFPPTCVPAAPLLPAGQPHSAHTPTAPSTSSGLCMSECYAAHGISHPVPGQAQDPQPLL